MLYTVDASAEEPIMLLTKHLGNDEEDGIGVDGSLFQQELLYLDTLGKKRIQIWINCPGGSVMEGYNIVSAILKSKTPVDTYNVFLAASMAGVIFMAGRKRVMADYSILMMHPPVGSADAKIYNAFMDSLATSLSAKSNLTEDKVKTLMARTTWMGADECLQNGFCTEIENTIQQNQKSMPISNNQEIKASWKNTNEIVNNIFNTDKSFNMSNNMQRLAMILDLNDGASEEQHIAAVKKITDNLYTAQKAVVQKDKDHARELEEITNKHKLEVDGVTAKLNAAKDEVIVAKTETQKATDELTTVKNSLATKEKDFTDIKTKYDASEKEKNDAVAAEKKTKAEAMINSFVRTGRIKSDNSDTSKAAIAKMVDLAIVDFDGTKAMIETFPISGKAPVITELDKPLADGQLETSTMTLAVRNKLKREGKLPESMIRP